jgi:Chaperone of endosialidase
MSFSGPTYSLPSSTVSPAVNGTPISPGDFNSLTQDFSGAFNSLVLRSGASPFSGPQGFASGNVSSPSIFINANSGTGIYQPTTGSLGFTCNGAGVLTLSAAGLTLNSGTFNSSLTDNITAAGTNQATATALTKSVNNVTTAASGTGVVLPVAMSTPGMSVTVINSSTSALLVYPAGTAQIDAGGASNPITVASDFSFSAYADSSGNWHEVGGGGGILGTANEIAVTLGNGTNTLSFAPNVVIPAPASGNGLVVNGAANTPSLIVANPTDTITFLAHGATHGVRITHTSGASTIDGVDNTGVGSFQPLTVQGSTLQLQSTTSGGGISLASSGAITVAGPTTFDTSVTVLGGLEVNGQNVTIISPASGQAFSVNNNGDTAQFFIVDASGEVQVANNLVVNTVTSSGTFNASDINLKTNIKTVPNPTAQIKELRGAKFNWIKDGKTDFGVIAQEIEQVLPELVHTHESGTKYVNYNGLIAILIESVKELSNRVKALEA